MSVSRFYGLALAVLLFSSACASGDDGIVAEAGDVAVADKLDQLTLDQQMLEARLAQVEEQVSALRPQVETLQGFMQGRSPGQAEGNEAPEASSGASVRSPVPVRSSAPSRRSGSAAEVYQNALADLQAGRYQQAETAFMEFVRRYGEDPLLPNAGYWLGETYYSQARYADAVLAFQAVVRQYPGHAKAAAALLKTAYSYERLEDMPNARFYLQLLLQDYPVSEPAALARKTLARLR